MQLIGALVWVSIVTVAVLAVLIHSASSPNPPGDFFDQKSENDYRRKRAVNNFVNALKNYRK